MSYNRIKKYRALKRQREKNDTSFEKNTSDDEFISGPSSASTSDIESISQNISTADEQAVNTKHATNNFLETRYKRNAIFYCFVSVKFFRNIKAFIFFSCFFLFL